MRHRQSGYRIGLIVSDGREEIAMRRCWLLIITKDLRVWMPPEVYLEKGMALRESRRWVATLSRRRPVNEMPEALPARLPGDDLLHVVETDFAESWRACPLWVGINWSEKSFPKITGHVLAADVDEATDWVRRRAKFQMKPHPDQDWCRELFVERKGTTFYFAVHRVKRFSGF